MKIADIEIGAEYGLGYRNVDPADAYAKVTVTAKGGGLVTITSAAGEEQVESRRIIAPWAEVAEAKRERRLLEQVNARRFDQRTIDLEEARQRILAHLGEGGGVDLPYDLNPGYALGKPVRPHSDRSGHWTGTHITLDYIQIANLLDIATKGA